MPAPAVRKVGDKILVEHGLGERELAKLGRYRACTQLSLTRVELPDLSCVTLLPKLASVELYATRIADASALAKVRTLRSLFLNGIRDPGGLELVSPLVQLRSLSLLHLPITKLPDLSKLTRLESVMLWSCRRLANIRALAKLPRLVQLRVVDTPQTPRDLAPIVALDHVKYVAAQFGSNRLNREFAELLAKHGKQQYPS